MHSGLDAATMQAIAHDVGFSETAFVTPATTGELLDVRYFSPVAEVPFCGHAAIATAWRGPSATGSARSGGRPVQRAADRYVGSRTSSESCTSPAAIAAITAAAIGAEIA